MIPNNKFAKVYKETRNIVVIGPFRMFGSTFKDNPLNSFDTIDELVYLCGRTDNPKDLMVDSELLLELNRIRKSDRKTSIDAGIRSVHIKRSMLLDERGNPYGNRKLPRDEYSEEFGSSTRDDTTSTSTSRKRHVEATESLMVGWTKRRKE